MAAKRFNIGIIGYGLSAKIFHIPFINAVPDFRLYAIVQRSPKPDDDASKDWPDAKVYKSVEELCNDAEVDVVVVTTAPISHFELAKMAMEKGKNVVVEKPFTPTSAEARELVKLAKEKGVVLTVYQNRRFDADFLTVKKLLRDGTLGRIVEFETHFDRHRPEAPKVETWKTKQAPGTGAVYDLGTHLMDQVVDLFGLPENVTGFVGSQRKGVGKGGLEDSCTVVLRYRREKEEDGSLGLLVTVKAGVVSCEERQIRYWIRGEKGSWRKYGLDVQEDQLRRGLRPGSEGYAVEEDSWWGDLTVQNADGRIEKRRMEGVKPQTYCEFYRRLASALHGNMEDVPVGADVAAEVIRLVELARESSKLGRTLSV